MEDEKFFLELNEKIKRIDELKISEEEKDKLYNLVEKTIERHYNIEKNTEKSKKSIELLVNDLKSIREGVKNLVEYAINTSKYLGRRGFSRN